MMMAAAALDPWMAAAVLDPWMAVGALDHRIFESFCFANEVKFYALCPIALSTTKRIEKHLFQQHLSALVLARLVKNSDNTVLVPGPSHAFL